MLRKNKKEISITIQGQEIQQSCLIAFVAWDQRGDQSYECMGGRLFMSHVQVKIILSMFILAFCVM